MATNSNIPPQKKVVSVEILHLDDLGYGPNGSYTRREWRNACLNHLGAGADVFLFWQKKCIEAETLKNVEVEFDFKVVFADGSIETRFNNLRNRCSLDCIGQVFDSLDADGYNFMLNALFDWSSVNGYANFSKAIFEEYATFMGATFHQDANFIKVVFNSHLHFSDAIFRGLARFTDAEFHADAVFDNVKFNGSAGFEESHFFKNAWFNSVVFNDYAWFIGAKFEYVVEFYSAVFVFDGKFENANFASDATFLKAKFESQGLFKNANFSGDANFMAATFEILGLFEYAKFHSLIPNFRGCQIDRTRLEFSDDRYFPENTDDPISIKNISFLKRLSDEHGQTDQALNFNAMELRSKLAQTRWKTKDLTFPKKLINADYWYANSTELYDKFSDFGRSFTKPLKFYIRLLFITLFLATAHAVYYTNKECKNEYATFLSYLWRDQIVCVVDITKPVQPAPLSGWRAAFEYTIYRSAGILDFSDNGKGTEAVANRLFGQQIEPPWMRAWGVFKAIASTALLFLAALGLRNKYRIK